MKVTIEWEEGRIRKLWFESHPINREADSKILHKIMEITVPDGFSKVMQTIMEENPDEYPLYINTKKGE